jgi:natural product biosynthesis luciferase-like monooxygenase protein
MPFNCYLIGADTLLLECGNLLLAQGHSILGVVTGAEKVRSWAAEKGVPCLELDRGYPDALRDEAFDYLFSITHLSLIPDEVLALPKRGAINFHDGPLPRYAGLNAPAWALMNRESTYGITWHLMTAGVDEGDILEQRLFDLTPNETSLTLNTRNFQVAIESFGELIQKLETGTEQRTPQISESRSYFGRHQRPAVAALLNWDNPASVLEALVRGLDFGGYDNPLCLPKLWWQDRAFAVLRAEAQDLGQSESSSAPGTVTVDSGAVRVATAQGVLHLLEVRDLHWPSATGSVADVLGIRSGDVLTLPPAPVLATIDRELERLSKAESFWTRRLAAGAPAEITLAQPGSPPGEWSETELAYPNGPQDAEVALPSGVQSRQLTALAALGLYLGRTSGKNELVLAFNSPTQRELAESLAGLVASYVPLEVRWSRDGSVGELRATLAGELSQLAVKGSYWRDLIARRSSASHVAESGMSPVAVRLETEPPSPVEPPPGTLLEVVLGAASIRLRTRQGAFPRPGIAAQLETALSNVSAHPDAACGSVSLLTEDESRRVLVDWNATATSVDTSRCIHQLFEQQVERDPNRKAVSFRGDDLSYAELNGRANALARELIAAGAQPDQLIGVMVQRSAELLIATLGVMKAGAAYVPLDPAYPSDRIKYMLQDSNARLVVTQSGLASAVPDGVKSVFVDRLGEGVEQNVAVGVRSDNLAYVIYTSGSTGLPKGVMVEHRNVVNFFSGMDDVIPNEGGKVWLSVTSLSFDISVLELFWTLARGFTIVLHRDDDKAGPGEGAEAASTRPVDFSLFLWGADDQATSSKYELMLHAGRFGDVSGFSAVWTPERHFHAFGGPYPNPAVTGAALAAVTSKLQIRAGSCVVPLHHPVRVAEEWAVVDNLSGGRAGISFASGWQPDDFLLRPESYKDNKRVMVEAIDQVRRLWRGEALTFQNGMGKEVSIVSQPRPVQKELPYWVTTAGNPETFRIAGESGANLLTHLLGQSLQELEGKLRVYREARAAAGYDPSTGIVSLMLHTYVGESEAVVKERARQPMKDYLRTSVNLIKGFAWAFPAFKKPAKGGGDELDVGGLSDEDLDTILEFAFERYYEHSGLFGTPETCLATIDRVRAIGVDDVACLIDFGIPTPQVKQGLEYLGRLKRLVDERSAEVANARAGADQGGGDFGLAGLCGAHSISHMQCTPALMRMALMDEDTKRALLAIPHLMLGGEALPLDLTRELSGRPMGELTNMYGPTETTIWSSTHRFERDPDTVPIGRPIANTQLYVLDTGRQPVPVGVPGELYIAGAGVVRGYHQRPELTEERFVPDAFGSDGARMYRTGDLVRWRDDGVLEFLGRTDHQVKIRGYRIELGEIETALCAHPDVDQGVVLAREDSPGDQRLVAYYTGNADVESLRVKLREGLPEFMIPSAFCRLPRLPHTPNGKVDRKALPAPDAQGPRTQGPALAPESDLETTVVGLWQEVLGIDAVGVTDNFFDLGGHSLLVVRLHQMLKQALSPAIPMTALYRFPTIRTFVENLNDGDSSEAAKQATDRGQMRREQLARRRDGRARAR